MSDSTSVNRGRFPRFRELEGRIVTVTLADGSKLQDVTIVSAGRHAVASLWVDVDGMDLIIRHSQVIGVEEKASKQAA